MTPDEWKREMAEIDGELNGELDGLLNVLQSVPESDDAQLKERIWGRLVRNRRLLPILVSVWKHSWSIFPFRRLLILAAAPVLAWAVTFLMPATYGSLHLDWWGLISPWAGFLAIPMLSHAGESDIWAEWETAAPVDPGRRVAMEWSVMMLVMILFSTIGAIMTPHLVARMHTIMMWLGPFGLTSVAVMTAMRKIGMAWSVVISSAFWGIQLLVGLATEAHHTGDWLLWFANTKAPLWPDVTIFLVAVGVALIMGMKGERGWRFD